MNLNYTTLSGYVNTIIANKLEQINSLQLGKQIIGTIS